MNPIERITVDLTTRFPGMTVEMYPSATESGFWHADITGPNDLFIFLEWRPDQGFGVSTPKPDEHYGSGNDEFYEGEPQTLDRLSYLITTGSETIPPLAVRLAELRQMRGMSQTEVAERAGLKQANLSRLEGQDDAKLSTLEKIIHALGGQLVISAQFPDGQSVALRIA